MKRCIISIIVLTLLTPVMAEELESHWTNPPETASPWVFWYWVGGAVSREGITADLEAIKDVGIEGVYLFTVRDVSDPPLFDPPARQMTPLWWDMVRHAMAEADRLGLKMGLHACDGFSLAGGPWITPEKSMQKLVWTETVVQGGQRIDQVFPQPETQEDYYRDVALLALPSPPGTGVSTRTVVPQVSTNVPKVDPQFLVDPENNSKDLRSSSPCWFQYTFEQPFTCRSMHICARGRSLQSLRLRVEASDDGQSFRLIRQLQPPRHGWQNGDADYTVAIEPTKARIFRFVYDPNGSEPGSEDLEAGKWHPSLRLRRLELSSQAQIHQVEGKSGLVWRMSPATTAEQVPDDLCVPQASVKNLSQFMDSQGRLQWDAPAGQWTLIRMGMTTTGHQNDMGGGAKGLECDKFDPEVVAFQFDQWFGEIVRQIGPDLAQRVLRIFHTDSWEAGSQNWSPVFRAAFEKRRGYDPLPWLPTMAGVPIESAAASEKFLWDLRKTIDELVNEQFFGTMARLAHEHGCQFSSESVAPTMVSDNLRHFDTVDIPMGEFWLRSPSHDKPNDMRDAISGAHIYGKPMVQAEAFTEIHFAWDEYPGMLKALGDRNYAMGINRLVYHVCTQNPWLDRHPGPGLGITGLFFQRDQTWFKTGGRAWVDYHKRCQTLLQVGRPVVDVAVFTGDDLPSRAVLPERLIDTLPGLLGADAIKREKERLANKGQPMRRMPPRITSSANITDPADWIDPLRGYAYDSINAHALLQRATLKDKALEMPGGVRYRALVVPGPRPMSPNAMITPATRKRIEEVIQAGIPVIMADPCAGAIPTPYQQESLSPLNIEPDVKVEGESIAWAHRTSDATDIYFIANQQEQQRIVELSLRVTGRVPELWNPVDGQRQVAQQWQIKDGRTLLPVRLPANGSVFIVLREATSATSSDHGLNWIESLPVLPLDDSWQVTFGQETVVFDELVDWTSRTEPAIQSYSGTALYIKSFDSSQLPRDQRIWLDLGTIHNVARITLNGKDCGTVWTPPYRVEITDALRSGANELSVEVTNTWANRLIGDSKLAQEDRTTWTPYPQMAGRQYRPAGLLGPVEIVTQK